MLLRYAPRFRKCATFLASLHTSAIGCYYSIVDCQWKERRTTGTPVAGVSPQVSQRPPPGRFSTCAGPAYAHANSLTPNLQGAAGRGPGPAH